MLHDARCNRFLANTWWGSMTLVGKLAYGARIIVTGDEIPAGENAVVAPNHQQMADITFLFFFALSKHRLGDLKWFLKDHPFVAPVTGLATLTVAVIIAVRIAGYRKRRTSRCSQADRGRSAG